MEKLAIIGAGELGKLVAYHADMSCEFKTIGFYDDFVVSQVNQRIPVLGTCKKIFAHYEEGVFDKLFIGVGYARMKARIEYFEMFKGRIPFANIIHRTSYVDLSCSLGEGIFVSPGCTLDFQTKVDDNVLLNTGVTIAHDSTVGMHSFLAPAVQIAGFVNVGRACFIGIGATVLDCLHIADESIIGAGSVVTRETREKSISYGVPAKFIRHKE